MKKLFLLTASFFILLMNSAYAEQFIIEANGYHTVSRKETIEFAEDAATNNALKWAVEQIGVRISAYTEVVNKVIKEDTVQRFASSVIQIRKKTLIPKVVGDDYRIYARVICVVDTADLDKWEPPDIERQRKLETDINALRQQYEQLQKEKEALIEKDQVPLRGDKLLQLGDKYYLEGEYDKAMKTWRKAAIADRQNHYIYHVVVTAMHRQAYHYWNQGKYDWFACCLEELRHYNNTYQISPFIGIVDEMYTYWVDQRFHSKPKHNRKINMKKFIQTNTTCVLYSELDKFGM